MISLSRLKELLHYDPDTGLFTWLVSGNKRVLGGLAGTTSSDGYIVIGIDYEKFMAHKLAYFYMTGQWHAEIDHKNLLRHDNRFDNLRPATRQQNMFNKKVRRDSKTGVKGVSWDKQRNMWLACVRLKGKRERFFTKDFTEACNWIKVTRETLHGNFARN